MEPQTPIDATTNPPAVTDGWAGPIVCAWCTRLLQVGVGPVSHGICADCAAALEVAWEVV